MHNRSNTAPLSAGSFIKGLLPSLRLNIAFPFVLYFLMKSYVTSSEIVLHGAGFDREKEVPYRRKPLVLVRGAGRPVPKHFHHWHCMC
jgi:hypothetical protein